MTEILGAVLAGGKSVRFGSDKALAAARGKPLIQHSIDALAAVTSAVIVCGRAYPPYAGVPDRPGTGLGPLGGLNAALHEARSRRCAWVLTIACDTPSMPVGLLQALVDGGCPQYVADHPVIGLWPSSAGDLLDRWFAKSASRSMRDWAKALGAVAVFQGAEIANFNHAQELADWLATIDGKS